jgi:hypothetical protein
MMAKVSGTLDPQTLALFKTVMDVWAAAGMNNPDDPESPVGAHDDPAQDPQVIEAAAQRDSRSTAQRQHDAFKAIMTTILEYKLLGNSHRGLPVQIIITMTKQQLDDAAGIARTASGVDIPVKDALELAAVHDTSLAVFANHSADVLYFGRAKRTAQTGQRLALFAKDRGCTKPGAAIRRRGWKSITSKPGSMVGSPILMCWPRPAHHTTHSSATAKINGRRS